MQKTRAKLAGSTVIAILEAAERLYGLYGIEGVSLRQINLEAKVSNKSAIQYHFGDRDQLIDAIWEYRLPVIEAKRTILLGLARERGRLNDARTILELLILPNCDIVDGTGRHSYAAFFRHVLRWRSANERRILAMHLTPSSVEGLKLIHALTHGIPREQVGRRLRFATCTFFDMLFERGSDIAEGRTVESWDQFIAEAFSTVPAIVMRPYEA